MEFSRQEYLVGYCFLLQEIFPIQGLNPCVLHLLNWWADSLSLSHPGEPTEGGEEEQGRLGKKMFLPESGHTQMGMKDHTGAEGQWDWEHHSWLLSSLPR